ncbi:MAG: prenyltransferase [Niameybacter sp.]|uniref:prenyltransferase n=1 Tax=Niameybacter sp. TaxID=2033640 RepID=UPI002FC7C8B8
MKDFFKRSYTVMEVRTGFATGLPILSGGLFGAYLSGGLKLWPLIFFFISGFSFNIVANVANEIRGYLKAEEDEATFTWHKGSEGLVRGEATLKDAWIVLAGFFILASASGLMVVLLTKSLLVLMMGLLGAVAALTYSLGPKPYIVYPIGEAVSGFLVGGVSSWISTYLQVGAITTEGFLYAVIPMMMTVFLMSTNNTSDYEKDKGSRTTLPHVIGFRNSIKLIIPEAVVMVLSWIALCFVDGITWWMLLSGLLVFVEFGYRRWYKDYYKIQEVYPAMGREWGPRPLLLIYSFNLILGVAFLIGLLFK